ncbi:MAG: hypothetical protein NC913_06665 [Candidatus Omnitrophica bacterium]|nr:hypothetical protein [Candidatus Omnitrophota bacterium]
MNKYILCFFIGTLLAFAQPDFVDPIFNMDSIINEPLDAKIISEKKKENIVIQEVEFTSEQYQGKLVRIYGIVAFPEGAKNLPAIFWSQGGMAPANTGMPELFAKRGYVCMCVTLPHSTWNPWIAFNTKNPEDANMTHFAIAQMRAITYLSSIQEVDPEKIGVGGSSYGGFFSTLIAGADPRIKCGMSFFAGGNMALGTNLPQFTKLQTTQDVEVWNRTIDPALRLKYKKVPFLWGVASNDNWFYLPSVVKTYQDSIGEKRIAIVPMWEHGFPEEIDEQLFSWFDIYLKQSRKPYNQVSDLSIQKKGTKLIASWNFKGENKVKTAELVVSYGKVSLWKYWLHRDYVSFPAKIQGNTATGEIPVVEPDIEMLVFGNIIDENGFLTSTVPVLIKATDYGIKKANCKTQFNLFQWKTFDKETEKNFGRMGMTGFVFDYETKKDGMPSLMIEPQKTKSTTHIALKLHNVPLRSHVLKMWVKAEKPMELLVSVKGVELPNSRSDIVRILRQQGTDRTSIPEYSKKFTIDQKWKMLEIECPYNNEDIEGYNLVIQPEHPIIFWINKIVFQPVWKK